MPRMVDIIRHKQLGGTLGEDEIGFFVKGVADGTVPDYQATALIMAIYFNGMDRSEIYELTRFVAECGGTADLSGISGKKIDKHSTGGVGDKVTFVALPMVAAACSGISVAKLAGRGLGFTGGTVDKLESIPGINTSLSRERFKSIVADTGICIACQSTDMAPVDKKLYALRDVTSTVNCFPLIAASIVGRFLAAGGDCLLLDIKCGSGGLVKNVKAAMELADMITGTARMFGKRSRAVITDMDEPLGRCIGNSLEMIEAIDALNGKGDERLTEISLCIAANMLYTAGVGDLPMCEEMALNTIRDGSALKKLHDMVVAMGGNGEYIYNTSLFEESKISALIASVSDGYISSINTEMVGHAAATLGAGRSIKDAPIDHRAGIVLHKKIGDHVSEGEALATIYTNRLDKAQQGMELLFGAINLSDQRPEKRRIVIKTVDG